MGAQQSWCDFVTSTAGLQAAGSVVSNACSSSSATNAPITVQLDSFVVTAP